MQLIETTVTETSVLMRFADNADRSQATEWIDFAVPVAGLTLQGQNGDIPLGDIQMRHLASIRLAALRHARGVIGDEIHRLSQIASH